MGNRLALGAALLALALVLALALRLTGILPAGRAAQPEPAPGAGVAAVAPPPGAGAVEEAVPGGEDGPRTGAGSPSTGAFEEQPARHAEPAAVPAAAHWIEGRALDTAGAPLSEVEIRAVPGEGDPLARTLPDGSFRFETRAERLELEGGRPGWTTVRTALARRDAAEREALVVLAPAVSLAGHVIDAEGRGIPAATLEIEDDWLGIAGFPLPLDGTEMRRVETTTDDAGAFSLPVAPRLPERVLWVRKHGYRSAAIEVPAQPQNDLEVRLEGVAPEEEAESGSGCVVFGSVRLPDGAPAAGARVQLAWNVTTSDADGRFELAREDWMPEDALLVAMLAGWQPAVQGSLGSTPSEPGARIGPLELTLPGPALSIRGRLELAGGAPAEGWRVRLLDPTVLDEQRTPPPVAESGGEPPSPAVTDGRGRFELTGLADRDYSLRLWEPGTFASVDAGPVPAGEQDLVLRVPADALLEELTGRVTARGGVPVEGARVNLQFVTHRTRTGATWQTPASTRTDADGRFVLRDVPRRRVSIMVGGDDLVWTTYEPEGAELDGRPLEIEVERLVRARLDFSSLAPPPSAFRMLDSAGKDLSIEMRSAQGRTTSTSMSLQGGRSAVVAVSEAAATLVLLDASRAELERRPVSLVPGVVNDLAP